MPADDLYWNPIDFDSDGSLSNSIPRQYVDPWDLENYAYIRQHLDSLEISSEDSAGEAVDKSSSMYYASSPPAKRPPKFETKYDTSFNSDYEMAKYAEIKEDIYGRKRIESFHIKQNKHDPEDVYGIINFGVESDSEDTTYDDESARDRSIVYIRDPKEIERTRPVMAPQEPKNRRYSYSYGDYGYEHQSPRQKIYSRLDDITHRADSEKTVPIYDDIRTNRFKPKHFGLSNYGHLKIDYSFSWNNLNKYICN